MTAAITKRAATHVSASPALFPPRMRATAIEPQLRRLGPTRCSALPRPGLGPSFGRDLRCGRTPVPARPTGGPIVGQAVASRG